MIEVIKRKDKETDFWVHRQAWLNAIVKNVKKNGKPQFRHFDDFYKDAKTEKKTDERMERLAQYMREKSKDEL